MEAYTTAMVLDDMTRSGSRFRFRILGTDISTAVLRLAKTAIYTRDVLAPVPADFIKRYFLSSKDRSSGEVRVVPELRRLTNFMRMNLMDSNYSVDRDVDNHLLPQRTDLFRTRDTSARSSSNYALTCGPRLFDGGALESMIHSVVPGLKQVQPTIFRI